MSTIIGFNSGIHDAGVSLIQDGVVKAVYTEEKFSNVRMKGGTINQSLAFLVKDYRIDLSKVDHFATTTSLLNNERMIPEEHDIYKLYRNKITFYPNHHCHGIGSLIFSNFTDRNDVMVLTLDGGDFNIHNLKYGEIIHDKVFDWIDRHSTIPWHQNYKNICNFVDGSLSVYRNGELQLVKQFNTNFFRLYFFVESWLIFYNKSNALNINKNLLTFSSLGKFNEHVYRTFKNMCIFDKGTQSFQNHFPAEAKTKNFEHGRLHDIVLGFINEYDVSDVCFSLQKCVEDILMEVLDFYQEQYGCKYICLSGSIFSNLQLTKKINQRTDFEEIFVMPSMDDDGTSIGAALAKCIDLQEYKFDQITNCYLGKEFTSKEIDKFVKIRCYNYIPFNFDTVVDEIKKGKIIGIFNGKNEIGPKSLGNRSIIADANNSETYDRLISNLHRNQYTCFEMSVLDDFVTQILESKKSYFSSQFMTVPNQVKESWVNKLTSVVDKKDKSCIPQIVTQQSNSWFYELMSKYYQQTNMPVLLNTDFTIHPAWPTVNKPLRAWEALRDKKIDVLVMGNYIIYA